jgi:hypothetical protein
MEKINNVNDANVVVFVGNNPSQAIDADLAHGMLTEAPSHRLSEMVKAIICLKIKAIDDMVVNETAACLSDMYDSMDRFHSGLFLSKKELKKFIKNYFNCFEQHIQRQLTLTLQDVQIDNRTMKYRNGAMKKQWRNGQE